MDKQGFIERFRGLPVLFPLVAAFHAVMLISSLYRFISDGDLITGIGGGTVIVWLLYTVLWIYVWQQQRRAAIGYIVLTAINLLLHFATPPEMVWRHIGNTAFPFDVLMCFFLLFYYKRFR